MSSTKHKTKIPHNSKAARIRGNPRVPVQNIIGMAQDKKNLFLSRKYFHRSKYSLRIDSTMRASYKMLPPIRFIDLIPKYRTVGDLCIICKTGGQYDPEDIYGERVKDMFMPLNSYKRFSMAEFSERLGVFSLNMVSFKNDFFPVKLVAERLESLQDRDAYDVAKLVRLYNKSLKEMKRDREENRRVLKEKLYLESLKTTSFFQARGNANMIRDEGNANNSRDLDIKEEFPDKKEEIRAENQNSERPNSATDVLVRSSSSSRNKNLIVAPQVASNYFQREYRSYEEYLKKNEQILEKNKSCPMIIFTTEECEKSSKLLYEVKKLSFNMDFVRLINPDGDVRLNLNVLNTGIPPIVFGEGNYFCSLKQLLQGMIAHRFKTGEKPPLVPLEIRTLDGISLKAHIKVETTTFESLHYDEITTFLKLELNDEDRKRLDRFRINNKNKGVELQITSFYQDAIQNNLIKTTEFLNKCYPGAIPQNMMEQNSKKVCGFKLISEN